MMIENKRKPISTRSRFNVFKRDSFTCQYCGMFPPNAMLHVDHITPVSKGGNNEFDNLITACDKCNLGKSNILLTDIPTSLKDKAEEIKEREKQIKGYYKIINEKINRVEEETWEIATVLDSDARKDGFDKKWFHSIKMFLNKLPYHEVLDAMEKADAKINHRNDAFRYFCGICWSKIKNLPE